MRKLKIIEHISLDGGGGTRPSDRADPFGGAGLVCHHGWHHDGLSPTG